MPSYSAAPQVTEDVTATKASSTTNVQSSANPSVFSQTVTFEAIVDGTNGTPTGTVQFKVSGVNLGVPVVLDGSGKASSPATASIAVGNHTITAVYSGDSAYVTSTGHISQHVTKASVNVTVTSNHNPGRRRHSITFTVTVSPASPATRTPGGRSSSFRNATQVGATKALAGGAVSWTITWTAHTGTFHMTAKYLGNTNFRAATSPPYSQVITT